MLQIDLEKLRRINEQVVETQVAKVFGVAGIDAIKMLFDALRRLYRNVPPESINGLFVLFHDLHGGPSMPEPITETADFRIVADVLMRQGGMCQVNESCFRVWPANTTSVEEVSHNAVAYVLDSSNGEHIVADGHWTTLNSGSNYISMFALPTFWDLEESLKSYEEQWARRSTCDILQRAWFDEARICLKRKPEIFMRRSLARYLKTVLRASVRQEQNVDESHPVDIKVSWENFTALIEIKWLGGSSHGTGKRATEFSASRAVCGLHQLLRYIRAEYQNEPMAFVKGQLVVFDARRGGISYGKSPMADNLEGYRFSEITYPVEAMVTQMLEPKRIFLEAVG